MTIALPTYKPQLFTDAKEIKISEIEIIDINTKKQFILENRLKQLIIRNRNNAITKLNFDNGSENFTIPVGSCFNLIGLDLTDKILYIEASKVSTIEIMQLY